MVTLRTRKLEYNTRLSGAVGTTEGWMPSRGTLAEEMAPCKPHEVQ